MNTPIEMATFAAGRLEGQTAIPEYVVMTARAKMPSSIKAPYMKVAVVQTDRLHMPKQIHPRHKAVKRIVRVWDRRFEGKTQHCAYRRALAEAERLAEGLNTFTR